MQMPTQNMDYLKTWANSHAMFHLITRLLRAKAIMTVHNLLYIDVSVAIDHNFQS